MIDIAARRDRVRAGGSAARAFPLWASTLLIFLLGFAGGVALLSDGVPRLFGAVAERALGEGAPARGIENVSARFGICAGPRRVTCVVDGDTIWLQGSRIRISDIDAPEIGQPGCAAEAALGRRATERLVELLNAAPFEVRRVDARDEDRYGRKLREIHRDGRSLGDLLVAEGLARPWGGQRESWCGA